MQFLKAAGFLLAQVYPNSRLSAPRGDKGFINFRLALISQWDIFSQRLMRAEETYHPLPCK